MGATSFGSRRDRVTVHKPSTPSWLARKAIVLPSGDQRGFEALQPLGSKGDGCNLGSGHSISGGGRRPGVGVGMGNGWVDDESARANQSTLMFLSSSTMETV
jgi:hypothetical protein